MELKGRGLGNAKQALATQRENAFRLWCHSRPLPHNDFLAENGCRVTSNQRIYPGEVTTSGFRPDLVIEI